MNLVFLCIAIGVISVVSLVSSFLQFKQRLITEAISHLIVALSTILLGFSFYYHFNIGAMIAGIIFLSNSWFLFFINYKKYKKRICIK